MGFFPWWDCVVVVVVVVGAANQPHTWTLWGKTHELPAVQCGSSLSTPHPHKYLRSNTGTRLARPGPEEAGLDQTLNGTQWASLLTTISFSFPFLHACLSRASLDVQGLFALPAAQVSWTISLSNRLRLLNRGIMVWLNSDGRC